MNSPKSAGLKSATGKKKKKKKSKKGKKLLKSNERNLESGTGGPFQEPAHKQPQNNQNNYFNSQLNNHNQNNKNNNHQVQKESFNTIQLHGFSNEQALAQFNNQFVQNDPSGINFDENMQQFMQQFMSQIGSNNQNVNPLSLTDQEKAQLSYLQQLTNQNQDTAPQINKPQQKINNKAKGIFSSLQGLSLRLKSKIDDHHSQNQTPKQLQLQDKILQDLQFPFQKYWIDANSKWYFRWTFFILMLNLVWIQSFLPIRMSFEDQRYIMLSIAVVDMIIDCIYIVENLTTFFIPKINYQGEYIFDRKLVAKEYLKFWFFLDCLGNVPYSMFKAFPGKPSQDNLHNFINFNFAYIPRFYIFCLALKLLRIRNVKKYLVMHMKRSRVSVSKMNLILTVWTLILILHMIACFWGVAGTFNLSSNQNWIYSIDMQDEGVFYSYLTSLYWASVTIITVGYGDILPQNSWETSLVCVIFVIGVAMFSYTLSALANQFSELSKSHSKRVNRDKQLYDLQNKYKLPNSLMSKIQFYFSQSESVISISRDYEMNNLLKVLPPNLKTRLALFLYHDAITAIPFLQNREQMFYLNFLDQLIPLKFQKHTTILKQGTRPEEIFLVLKGIVQNTTTKRALSMGSLIGETDYVYRRERAESFIALTDVHVLKYDINVFENILQQFPYIKDEIDNIAKKREKMRLMLVRQGSLIEEQEKYKLEIFKDLKSILNTTKDSNSDKDVSKVLGRFLSMRKTNKHVGFQRQVKSDRSQSLSSDSQENSLISTTRDNNHKSNLNFTKVVQSQLEQIDEIMDSNLTMQKTVSEGGQDLFQNSRARRQSSTFKLQDVQARISKISQSRLNVCKIQELDVRKSKQNQNVLLSPFKELLNNKNTEGQRDSKKVVVDTTDKQIVKQEQQKIDSIFMHSQSIFSSSDDEDRNQGKPKLQLFNKDNNNKQLSNLYLSQSNINQDKKIATPLKKLSFVDPKSGTKRHSSMELQKYNNLEDLYESDKSRHRGFLQSQDAFLYSNPDMKLQTLKSRVFDQDQNSHNTATYKNGAQNVGDQQKTRLTKIFTIIKKSKLILNEYGNLFTDYLDKLSLHNQNTVSEHIIMPTKQAIRGIYKYNQVLSFLESKLEQPKQILDNLDNIENILQPQIDFQKRLKDQINQAMLEINKLQARKKFRQHYENNHHHQQQKQQQQLLPLVSSDEKRYQLAILPSSQNLINQFDNQYLNNNQNYNFNNNVNDRSIDNSFRRNLYDYNEKTYLKAEQSFYENEKYTPQKPHQNMYSPLQYHEQQFQTAMNNNNNNQVAIVKEQKDKYLNASPPMKSKERKKEAFKQTVGNLKNYINSLVGDYNIGGKNLKPFQVNESHNNTNIGDNYKPKISTAQINNNIDNYQDEYSFTRMMDKNNPYTYRNLQQSSTQSIMGIESRVTSINPTPLKDNRADMMLQGNDKPPKRFFDGANQEQYAPVNTFGQQYQQPQQQQQIQYNQQQPPNIYNNNSSSGNGNNSSLSNAFKIREILQRRGLGYNNK